MCVRVRVRVHVYVYTFCFVHVFVAIELLTVPQKTPQKLQYTHALAGALLFATTVTYM